MEFLSKFFGKSPDNIATKPCLDIPFAISERVLQADYGINKIRLVIYRDSTKDGRQLVFDSKVLEKFLSSEAKLRLVREFAAVHSDLSIKKFELNLLNEWLLPASAGSRRSSTKQDINFDFSKRLPIDSKLLSEMIFGNMPLQRKSSTIKIHSFGNPLQLMISKIFSIKNKTTSKKNSCEANYFGRDCVTATTPISIPKPLRESSLPSSFNSEVSQLSYSSLPSPKRSGYQARSLSSRYMRWLAGQRGFLTSHYNFDYPDFQNQDKEQCRNQELVIGVALLLILSHEDDKESNVNEFQKFFFSYLPIIENIINELAMEIKQTMARNPRYWIYFFIKFEEELNERIHQLYCCPRLAYPAWLSITSSTKHKKELVNAFIKILTELTLQYSSHKRFMTSLLTAILTYHTSWVSTVAPAGFRTPRNLLLKHRAEWVKVNGRECPYDPYWAQLMELKGSLYSSSSARQCHTVIVGRNKIRIMKILFALSYFIRCSKVVTNEIEPASDEKYTLLDLKTSNTCSEELSSFYTNNDEVKECDEMMCADNNENSFESFEHEGHIKAVPLLRCSFVKKCNSDGENNFSDLGKSLFGGFTSHFMPDLILHGCSNFDFIKTLKDHVNLKQASFFEPHLSESVFIVGNIDSQTVQLYSSQTANVKIIHPSSLIDKMLQRIVKMSRLNISSEQCILCIEDKLQQFYLKAKCLHDLSVEKEISFASSASMSGIENEDITFLEGLENFLIFDNEASQFMLG